MIFLKNKLLIWQGGARGPRILDQPWASQHGDPALIWYDMDIHGCTDRHSGQRPVEWGEIPYKGHCPKTVPLNGDSI